MSYKKEILTHSVKELENIFDENNRLNYFTKDEIKIYGKRKNKGGLAARFLIKKYIIENLNINVNYTDIEILNNESGKPFIKFKNKKDIKLLNFVFSISHTKEFVSVLIVTGKK